MDLREKGPEVREDIAKLGGGRMESAEFMDKYNKGFHDFVVMTFIVPLSEIDKSDKDAVKKFVHKLDLFTASLM
jgi:hypothetical protein